MGFTPAWKQRRLCSQLLAGRRAVHTFLASLSPFHPAGSTSKKVTEFVALIEIPSSKRKDKRREKHQSLIG